MASPFSLDTLSPSDRAPRAMVSAGDLKSYAACGLLFLASMTGVLGACVALSLSRLF